MKIIIHNDNIDISLFNEDIKFNNKNDIDEELSKIAKKLKTLNLEAIFIKDNLSNNYLEFLGIRLAYHIRFERIDLPIFIISELSLYTLNKLNYLSKILFTDNIFLIKSEELENLKIPKIDFHFDKFLENIEIKPPKSYLSHHSITNEWAIDSWAKILNLETPLILNNRKKLENMLYYKYLKSKFEKETKIILPQTNTEIFYGKILLIDDKKEWNDIIKKYLIDFSLK